MIAVWLLPCMWSRSSPGASEMLMATAVQELAAKTPGKESIAMEGFARALRKVHT